MSSSTCPHHNLNVKHIVTLFEEVQSRYINKLKSIDEKLIPIDDRYKQKLAIYESYVKDLSIETRLLFQGLEELEKEAKLRVTTLENKLKKANASLEHYQVLSDASKSPDSFEREKWRIIHENLDLKHDVDSLATFISTAQRTGKWDTKRFRLKTRQVDSIIGTSNENMPISTPLSKEIQHRDERIQILQAEIEHLRKMNNDLSKHTLNLVSMKDDVDLHGQNAILSNKVSDLRSKLAEECQINETLKIDVALKSKELKDLEQELNAKKQNYEEHIQDLSSKLKAISDRHRETTTALNNDLKTKQQRIEQLTQQIEQVISEKVSFENERNDFERQCRLKDTLAADLETQVRHFERQLRETNSHPTVPLESVVSKIDYEKLNQELYSVRKRFDGIMLEIKEKDAFNIKLEQDIRSLKKIHDEQIEQHIQMASFNAEKSNTEIQTLKRLVEEKAADFHNKAMELRTCQDSLLIERNKNATNEHELEKLRNLVQTLNMELEQTQHDLKQHKIKNDQSDTTIDQLNSHSNLLERKLMETKELMDLCSKRLMDSEQQTEKLKNELLQKNKEFLDKQSHMNQLEQDLISKTAEVAQLTERIQTDSVKSQQKEKAAEECTTKMFNDIQVLQNEFRHVSELLTERERMNTTLTEQVQKLTSELHIKTDEIQQMQKTFNKQLTAKQDQLVRYDENLHDAEIKYQYAKEECMIQEKEILRLNKIQEDQANRIKILQQDLIQLQQHRDSLLHQYERADADLRNVTMYREDENRKYGQEFEKLNSDIATLKTNEINLLKNIEELKQNLSVVSNERDEIREQNDFYQHELENMEKLLYEETESSTKSATKVTLLMRQLDEEQKRSNDALNQLSDIQMQLTSTLMSNDTLKSELNQARLLIQDYTSNEADAKQNINKMNAALDDKMKSLEERQQEIETLNHLLSHIQLDYETSKNDLSIARDQVVQYEIGNQTMKQHLLEKTNELTSITNRFHQLQQDLHAYEKTHRYSNDDYFEREQRIKYLEHELTTTVCNYEKLQKMHEILNEELNKYQLDLQDMQRSDSLQKERLMQLMDESKIYKQKLALLGDCFRTIIRKASETSERWAIMSSHLDEQMTIMTGDVNRIVSIDERFEQLTRIFMNLYGQHEDFLVQFSSLKQTIERTHVCLQQYKRKYLQIIDDNRRLNIELKYLREKLDDSHRTETTIRSKLEQQDNELNQLRKEHNNELKAHAEARAIIDKLKFTLGEITCNNEQLDKKLTNANKKIEQLENAFAECKNDNESLHETLEKLEQQIHMIQTQKQSLETKLELNEKSHYEKTNEYESLLMSLKDANRNSVHLLDQREAQLHTLKSELQACQLEQSTTMAKLQQLEEINLEFEHRISIFERSIEEYKRLVRKREKELERIKEELESTQLNVAAFSNKCTKQEAEISVLRIENVSLNEELRLARESASRCQEQQRRLKKDCDQALNLIQDGVSDIW